MTTAATTEPRDATARAARATRPGPLARASATIFGRPGSWITAGFREVCLMIAGVASVVWLACLPGTWRRPVRDELMRQLRLTAAAALPTVAVLGLLIGVAVIYQALYWLNLAGQLSLVGEFLVYLVVRELGPVVVFVYLTGRSGTAITAEVGIMRSDGGVHAFDAMGLDPFVSVVVPRVVAMAVSTFCLTIVFIAVALVSGFTAAHAVGIGQANFTEFLREVAAVIGPGTHLLVFLKAVLIGLSTGMICCRHGLAVEAPTDLPGRTPRAFVQSLIVGFLLSGTLTVLLS